MDFSYGEVLDLTRHGWGVRGKWAYKEYNRILKKGPCEFEVDTLMVADGDRNDYWELDSQWSSLNDLLSSFKS